MQFTLKDTDVNAWCYVGLPAYTKAVNTTRNSADSVNIAISYYTQMRQSQSCVRSVSRHNHIAHHENGFFFQVRYDTQTSLPEP